MSDTKRKSGNDFDGARGVTIWTGVCLIGWAAIFALIMWGKTGGGS